MIAGTSTVSTATWRHTDTSLIPSNTPHFAQASPTIFSNVKVLLPSTTPSPSCCPPNEVVIQLSTALVISDYTFFYSPTPIASFYPTYYALDDGSLITPPFIDDMRSANLSLLMTGILTMLFVRNIFVSGNYIRRGKVKRKTLFYLLFLSQLLAPVCFIPLIMTHFNQYMKCPVVMVVACLASAISLALLITGILGVKAYKCLNSSRIVLVALGLFLCASTAVAAIDIQSLRGERRLSGSCIRISDLRYVRIYVMIQFVESLFICCCFIYAVWKSHGLPAARGRISLVLSMNDPPADVPDDANAEKAPVRRGWWDYVPNIERPVGQSPQQANISKDDGLIHFLRFKLTGMWSNERRQSQTILLRKPSLGELPLSQPARPSTVRISETPPERPNGRHDHRRSHGRSSPAPSSLSRLSRLMPRMVLFQEVMRDELYYTTFITATCVVVLVLSVIGVNFKNGLTVTGWIAMNWGVISVLAIHSFGRVVRRHEREAMLQHPTAWDSAIRAEQATPEAFRQRRTRRPWSPVSFASHRRVWRSPGSSDLDERENPFADTRRLRHSQSSWNSAGFVASASGSNPPSPGPTLDSFIRDPSRNVPIILPSPLMEEFPSSGRNTPIVRHDSLDGTLVQGFHSSWHSDCGIPDSQGHRGDDSVSKSVSNVS